MNCVLIICAYGSNGDQGCEELLSCMWNSRLLDVSRPQSVIYTWQDHGLIYVARPQVNISGCNHLISPMSTNIVETAMAIRIQWKRASQMLLHGRKSTG
ncbi:Uncharacterized protein TCM_017855 [Theobroma cacao]|uniref:Uncharacterized protein n=1 Tax=Theobroma cacao TaxID=3641 RepID=A0A061EF37_THECC|nr:Uncharacterized protein TCM_017855 [Theobroma cacao]